MILPRNMKEIMYSIKGDDDGTFKTKEPTYYELAQKVKELEIENENLKNKLKENL